MSKRNPERDIVPSNKRPRTGFNDLAISDVLGINDVFSAAEFLAQYAGSVKDAMKMLESLQKATSGGGVKKKKMKTTTSSRKKAKAPSKKPKREALTTTQKRIERNTVTDDLLEQIEYLSGLESLPGLPKADAAEIRFLQNAGDDTESNVTVAAQTALELAKTAATGNTADKKDAEDSAMVLLSIVPDSELMETITEIPDEEDVDEYGPIDMDVEYTWQQDAKFLSGRILNAVKTYGVYLTGATKEMLQVLAREEWADRRGRIRKTFRYHKEKNKEMRAVMSAVISVLAFASALGTSYLRRNPQSRSPSNAKPVTAKPVAVRRATSAYYRDGRKGAFSNRAMLKGEYVRITNDSKTGFTVPVYAKPGSWWQYNAKKIGKRSDLCQLIKGIPAGEEIIIKL